MHELSIAYNLVQIATDAANKAGVPQIDSLHLRLGVLSGVVKDALLFGYDLAIKNTPLAGSKLLIEELPVIIFCQHCQAEQTLTSIQLLQCPICGQPSAEIVQGKEMHVVSLEYTDATTLA